MSDLIVRTNNQPRDVLSWYDLTDKERAEFDYLDTETKQDDARFMRYRDWTYDLGEFTSLRNMPEHLLLQKWHGYLGDSYFSGIVVRYVDDFERVIAGTYTC